MSPLTDGERSRIEEYLAEAGDRVLHATKVLTPAQMTFRPRHDRWSIAENVEHLTIVDRLVLGQIVEILSTGATFKESAWKGQDDALLERVRGREPAIKAPEIISPRGQADREQILNGFDSGRRHLSEFVKNTQAPLRSYCFPHPIFGDLDCYQWLLCSGAHYERHLEQINEVLNAAEFPSVESL